MNPAFTPLTKGIVINQAIDDMKDLARKMKFKTGDKVIL